jgi:DNA integrity scanning protein DisA with diadenylate cyclase activity
LKTEEFLIKDINDDVFVKSIERNQTIKLIEKYKEKFPNKKEEIKLAEQVNLLTPENIHINSFMYEPILDLGNTHLKQLYKKVSGYPKK